MKLTFVTATQTGGLSDQVCPNFGRAPTFTVVTVEDGSIVGHAVIQNPYQAAPSGAGIQAAQLVASHAPKAVFAGSFGPNASGVLAQAGIELVPISGMTVEQAVKAYLVGELSPQPGGGPGAGFGPGMGMGRGRGPPPPPPDPEGLRERISRLENELAEIKRKLEELGGE
ncbi:NifB/NifX family molybdenum-iron cluster-binding protein [Candidatus Bipolaricaulota bacterium]|nr:NifB/NifX family molybdenum-iron cluster-binding protein [Candidatus Bipolaricaulota bacterium]